MSELLSSVPSMELRISHQHIGTCWLSSVNGVANISLAYCRYANEITEIFHYANEKLNISSAFLQFSVCWGGKSYDEIQNQSSPNLRQEFSNSLLSLR